MSRSPAYHFHAVRFRLLALAGCLCLFGTAFATATSHHSASRASFARAQHLRESLERRPERTRREYDRVMDAYRAIYHADPASPHAPASVFAVADLLAEEGRAFREDKLLHDAIGQYEFLRKNYPHSAECKSALLAEGEIYWRDLNDAAGARTVFKKFLKLYPESELASEARIELRDLRHLPRSPRETDSRKLAVSAAPKSASLVTKHEPATAARVPKKSSPPPMLSSQSTIKAPERDVALDPGSIALPRVTGIRYWSTLTYTRVALDLQTEVRYEAVRVSNPNRIYFDLYGARLSPRLIGKPDQVVDDGVLHRIHIEQFSSNVTRVVLNVSDVSQYYAFFLPNPARLIIDVRGRLVPPKPLVAAAASHPQVTRAVHHHPKSLAALHAVGLGPNAVPDDNLGEPLPRSRAEVASNRVRATPQPTMDPVEQTFDLPAATPDVIAKIKETKKLDSHLAPQPSASGGQLSMARALGLKINRIVIDAGHGGHDSGTLGPDGMEEKNVVLDVALRLGALLKQRLGADVIYTRDDDTFIPLETRTAIANKDRADLFISIHANSSPDPAARGVETYFLNFTTSADALEVAARENAVSNQSIHQLSDLVKKIALQDKIEESREFAADVQQSLYQGLEQGNPGLKDRGVKKAPFVVLIGANMPSILTEISFLTNPEDANELRQPRYRERISEALYRGVARYVDSLNGVRLAEVAPGAPR